MGRARQTMALVGGASLLVVLALSASTASAGSPGVFECESYTCYSLGTQLNTHKFKTNAGTVECKKATFEDELTVPSNWLKATATYAECTAFSFPATVEMRSCAFEFHAGNEIVAGEHEGTVDVIKKPGATKTCNEESIRITAGTCVVTVGEQAGLKTVKFKNEGAGTTRHVKVTAAVTGIKYTQSAGCPGGGGTFTNGEYTGEVDVKCYTDTAHTIRQGCLVK